MLCKKASSTKGMVTPWPSQKVPESTQQKSNHWNVSGADGQRQHVQHRSDHFIPHWAAARKCWRGYACADVCGSHLRAKEATKAYPRRLWKCPPARARALGAVAFGKRRQRKLQRRSVGAPSRGWSPDASRQIGVPGLQKKSHIGSISTRDPTRTGRRRTPHCRSALRRAGHHYATRGYGIRLVTS